jgi:ABC-2 type transport system permease protein
MLKQFLRNLRAWYNLDMMGWKSVLVYRLQAIIWGSASVTSTITGFVIVTVVYSVSSGIPGWSYFQLLALTSLANITGGVFTYCVSIYSTVKSMRNGKLDVFLTKPLNPVMYTISAFSSRQAATAIAGGVLMLCYSLLHLSVGLPQVAYFLVTFLLGIILAVMFGFAFGMLMYVLFKNGRFGYSLLQSLQNATSYPLSIYGTFGVALFTVVVPFGVAVSYPAEILLGKLPPLAGLAIIAFEVLLTLGLYKFSMWVLNNRYESGGG